jgi:hypothetical protein
VAHSTISDDWKPCASNSNTPATGAIVGKDEPADADMLALGKLKVTDKEGGGTPTKFTPDEQQTVMTPGNFFVRR